MFLKAHSPEGYWDLISVSQDEWCIWLNDASAADVTEWLQILQTTFGMWPKRQNLATIQVYSQFILHIRSDKKQHTFTIWLWNRLKHQTHMGLSIHCVKEPWSIVCIVLMQVNFGYTTGNYISPSCVVYLELVFLFIIWSTAHSASHWFCLCYLFNHLKLF